MPDYVKMKDPDAVLDYGFNWNVSGDSWLGSDTISTSTWSVPNGLTEVQSGHSDGTTYIRISGGTVGNVYSVVNHIVTADGLEDDRTLTIVCEER